LTGGPYSASMNGSPRETAITRRGLTRIRFAPFLATGLVVIALGGAGAAAAEDSPCPPPDGRQFCVTVSHTPPEVSTASAEAPTFAAFDTIVQNVGTSRLTHVTVNACLVSGLDGDESCGSTPPGAFFRSAVPSAGTCTIVGSTARCELGALRPGAAATVDLAAGAPVEGAFRNVVSVTVKERASDSPGSDPNEDTITVSDPVTTLASGGPRASTFLPKGIATQLLAGDEGQTGQSKIPAGHDDLTAFLEITDDPPFVCPEGEICRGGGWVSATIPGTFDALQFVLHWPDEFVPANQTEKNFALFYIACDTCALEIIRDRCSSATPSAGERPCLWNIRDLGREGFEATLISSHNGKMH
jgi:hypothetical protein